METIFELTDMTIEYGKHVTFLSLNENGKWYRTRLVGSSEPTGLEVEFSIEQLRSFVLKNRDTKACRFYHNIGSNVWEERNVMGEQFVYAGTALDINSVMAILDFAGILE